MKGFEITVNTDKIAAAVHDGFVLVTLSCRYGIDITGGDDRLGLSLQWQKSTLHTGDKVRIVASDLDLVTTPVSAVNIDRQKLLSDYRNLEEFLLKEGRLK